MRPTIVRSTTLLFTAALAALAPIAGCEVARQINPQGQAVAPPAGVKAGRFRSADGTELSGWLIPGRHAPDEPVLAKHPTVVYFHGVKANPGRTQQITVDDALTKARFLTDAGIDVFAFDYRGFGSSQRSKNNDAKSLAADAAAALAYTRSRPEVDPDRVVLFGHSFGGGMALAAAADAAANDRPVAGVLAVGSFSSWRAAANDHLPILGLLATDGQGPEDWIQQVGTAPVLLIHAKDDTLVPVSHADRLAAAGRAGLRDVRLVEPERGGHEQLLLTEGPTQRAMLDFILRRQAAGAIHP